VLADFQTQFLRAIYDRQSEPPGGIQGNALGRSAQGCLQTYSDSVHATLCKALSEIFPVAQQFVGERFFDALALRYIQQHPSQEARLDDYGDRFAAFCATFEPVKQVPELPALLQLEWYWHRAFHSREQQPFDFDSFQQAAGRGDAICFKLGDQLALMQAGFAVDQLWLWHQPQWPEGQEPQLDKAVCLVIHRPDHQVSIERLSEPEYRMLSQLQSDPALDSLCDLLGEAIGELLPKAIARGWICDFYLEVTDAETDASD